MGRVERKASDAKAVSHHVPPAHQSPASPWAAVILEKFPPPPCRSVNAECDVLWHGISLGSVQVICPGCVPSHCLAHPSLIAEEQSEKQKRH